MTTLAVADEELRYGRIKSRVLRFLISESTIVAVLLVNTGVFLSVTLDPRILEKYGYWINVLDVACVVYFVWECVLKLWALGRKRYFASYWNMFDFAIVLLSVPVLVAPNLPESMVAGVLALRFARFLRVLRMVHYVNVVPAVKRLRTPVLCLILLTFLKVFVLDSLRDHTGGMTEWLDKGYAFFVVLVGFWCLARIYDIFDASFLHPLSCGHDPRLDGLLLSFLRMLTNIACLGLGAIFGLENAGYDPWTILAGIGIGGVAVAFASQETIANVIAGVLLFIQRPFRIGERIDIADVAGKVQSIGLRCVTIRSDSGETLIIPNRHFTTNVLKNIDARQNYMSTLSIPISSDTPADKVEEALRILDDIATGAPMLDDAHYVAFDRIPGDGSYVLHLTIKTRKWQPADSEMLPDDLAKMTQGSTFCHTQIVKRFNAAGIDFARPSVPIVNIAAPTCGLNG